MKLETVVSGYEIREQKFCEVDALTSRAAAEAEDAKRW